MLEQLLRLYTTFMATGVTSPMPHFVGPPGSGKSTVFQQLADLLGVKLHVINVSRINPLGLEGLEMPDSANNELRLLISEMWTKANEGDIYLFDEFLRGFPEVFNGLLDIFTAREVAGFELPRVFIAAASNSTVAYDAALEDRLLHIVVPDPRKSKTERKRLAKLIVDEVGLLPEMAESTYMTDMLNDEVLPMFDLLDQFSKKGERVSTTLEGTSVRKLIGQARLRQVQSMYMKELIAENNIAAMRQKKWQYVVLLSASPSTVDQTIEEINRIKTSDKLTDLQRTNIEVNLQILHMYNAKHTTVDQEDTDDDELFT